ncbi:cystathionine gamma-synthase [Proteus faecis]|uniref:Cystathionine gamma-synthase n=1 Tax=Proteus faecis TaxID=2050967 RepID=A0AAW7CN13_9GAMM|nr:cystathionine gamma-synthase [Proteus faecis]MBG3011994.1 cystathionine gamma-synthase [Proteus mirabilis]MDL5167663.1 cystathionine gamma-synthase [Proteus faecis]MDL5275648.1 cystathionine gamma-synthase [Proteus faecis]MDL5279061.1 cystathionine gamma-synthase [Proteus faecis]MDL5308063.1 cystathionine gamma-synthase [Proteus faecis]
MTKKTATIAIHNGLNEDTQFGCVVPPIYLSSTYNFLEFNQPREHDYSRRGNPTRDMVQKTLAELEGGVGAVVTSSGMSAIHLICTVFLKPGDVIVAPHDCYGGSYRLFNSQQERGAYRVIFVDQNDDIALKQALAHQPKIVFIETPSNPLLRITDIQKISELAHQQGALVVADNTFMSPVLQKPLTLGADIVVHSCTKYLNGHSDIVAGVVICQCQKQLEELSWWANNIGVTSGAFDSYLLLRGIRTLVPRIRLQQENAQALVAFLQAQPLVEKMYYPALENHAGHQIAKKQQQGFGAMLSFELKGGLDVIKLFLSQLTLFTLAESLGGVETLICHPATMTHAGMSEEAKKTAGISPSLLRISVGIEDSQDLINDLQSAFDAATKR